ncbi:MAG: hypothetical protein L0H23_08355, partial [Luteimonas sp.]|nr:hypothetical protein [Luteimonas sp.]
SASIDGVGDLDGESELPRARPGAAATRSVADAPDCDGCDVIELGSDRAGSAWLENRSGTLTLKARPGRRVGSGQALAWGSWELLGSLRDANADVLVFPGDAGLALLDLHDGRIHRIVPTQSGDIPLAMDTRHLLLAWLSLRGCDVEVPERIERQHVCIGSLPPEAVAAPAP